MRMMATTYRDAGMGGRGRWTATTSRVATGRMRPQHWDGRTGTKYPQDFAVKLCPEMRPGVKKIMELGVLPGGMGKKQHFDREGRG